MKDLYAYIFSSIDRSTIAGYIVFALIATLVGLLVPWITEMLFSDIVEMKSISALIAIAVFLICASLSSLLFETIQELLLHGLTEKFSVSVESATMMRILSLPSSFFTKYSSVSIAGFASYSMILLS